MSTQTANPNRTTRFGMMLAIVACTLSMAAWATTPPAASPAKPAPAASPARPAAQAPHAAPAAAADNVVYKWKDAHGVSQYSQTPPPKGVKFEVIQNAAAPATTPSSTPIPGSGQN